MRELQPQKASAFVKVHENASLIWMFPADFSNFFKNSILIKKTFWEEIDNKF